MTLDPRLHAVRDDLADEALRGQVSSPRFSRGKVAEITRGSSPLKRLPNSESGVDTHLHYGERVLVFDETPEMVWCQSQVDGYVGYTEKTSVSYSVSDPTHVITTMGSYRYTEPDVRSAVIDFLPRHARVALTGDIIERRAIAYARLTHDGYVPLSCLSQRAPSSKTIVEAVARYLGSPYLWGGKDFLGIDCSGLIQMGCRDLGLSLPRDVYMQQPSLSLIKNDRALLKAGDLLFIKSPPHVGVLESSESVIHADGLSMMVIRQSLDDFLRIRKLTWSDLEFRSLPG